MMYFFSQVVIIYFFNSNLKMTGLSIYSIIYTLTVYNKLQKINFIGIITKIQLFAKHVFIKLTKYNFFNKINNLKNCLKINK